MENGFKTAEFPNEHLNQAGKHQISILSALNATQETVCTKTAGN